MAPYSLSPRYSSSHAIVIGINRYLHASPLTFATADASSVADTLLTRFQFPAANVHVLLDDAATKAAILNSFYRFAGNECDHDGRIVFFFAGHGCTVPTRRGEAGFLVPQDGDARDLSSLIRWKELADGAETFDAKHVAFFVDACFSGLMITRSMKPGSMRFVQDMLVRPSTQVLTAGKANEVVADEGGPLPGHSPFTGHLIQALEGYAASKDGIITANGVMAYVYQAVAQDSRIHQTPHYGYLDGDGDLIFDAPILKPDRLAEVLGSPADSDVLVAVPALAPDESTQMPDDLISGVKECLADERHRIRLHDILAGEVRRVIALTGEDSFAVQGVPWSQEAFRERIARYDAAVADLRGVEALVGFWASPAMRTMAGLAPRRLADRLQSQSGMAGWLALRWYPVQTLLYAGGVAAVAAGSYETLLEILSTRVSSGGDDEPLLRATVSGLAESGDAFKLLAGHERHYTPRSEHIYKLLQPMFDDLLFLGSDYESAFDRFEILMALEYMHQADRDWAPIGRFGWKSRRGRNLVGQFIAEAKAEGASWEPLRSGFFGRSAERFDELARRAESLTSRLGWY